jgi:hypothetical protein
MDKESNGSSTPEVQGNTPAVEAGSGRVNRRALLRAGAAASPVLLTLASGPVSAGNTVGCMVASSFVSVATFKSRNPDTTVSCSSKKCEDWRISAATPPLSADLAGTVANLFGGSCGNSYDTQIVKDLLLQGAGISTSGPLGVLQHCMSLALSLKGGFVTNPGAVNVAYVKSVWMAYSSTGSTYTAPASGLVMSEAQLIGWLRALLGYAIP